MANANRLTEDRLTSIEMGARERHTLIDRVIVELVDEVRRLRGLCDDHMDSRADSKDVAEERSPEGT